MQQFPGSHESVEDIVIQKFLEKLHMAHLKVYKEGSGIDLSHCSTEKKQFSICKSK